MSATVSFAELDGQHVELLPARTLLSMFSAHGTDSAIPGDRAPGQVTQGVLNLLDVPGMHSGPDGSNNDGGDGVSNL
jgi:hypothetical protein